MHETSRPLSGCRCLIAGGVILMLLPAIAPGAASGAPPLSPLAEALYSNRTHDVGLLYVPVSNLGQFGGPKYGAPNWQGGNYLSISGLWVGVYISGDGQPHVSTVESTEFRPDLDARWTIYESYEGINGGARLADQDAQAGDDDNDGFYNEDFQNGLDDDGDGRVDEDYEAIGQQMFSCMYRDDTPEAIAQLPDHQPMNVLVQQRSFQWAAEGISEWVGLDFTVLNVGDHRLDQVYLGFYADFDAGSSEVVNYWTDDLAGWSHMDTTVADPGGIGACATRDVGMDVVWVRDTAGEPGVIGAVVFGHPTDDTGIRAPQTVGPSAIHWLAPSEIPATDADRYQLMSSGTKPEGNAATPNDYRCLIVVGPFDRLYPGESLAFQTALVMGDGLSGFRHNLAAAKVVYDGKYIDADDDPLSGVTGKERCLRILEPGQEIYWDDPCDTLSTVVTWRSTDCLWVDFDCDSCTGIDGRETHLNWTGEILPVSVELLSFTAERTGASAVIRWVVGSAQDHAGFHVYREEPGSGSVRITESPLGNRSEYEFVDPEAPAGAVAYWLLEISRTGVGTWYGPVALPPASSLPRFLAGLAAPNPFRSRMSLAYHLPEARPVRASVYDLSGRLVRVVSDADQGPGEYTAVWQGETDGGGRAVAGLYILRLEAGPDVVIRKVVLIP